MLISWVFEQDFLEYHTSKITLLLTTNNFIFCISCFSTVLCAKNLVKKDFFRK